MRLTREKNQLTHTKHQAPNDARKLNVFRSSNISYDMRLTREKIQLTHTKHQDSHNARNLNVFASVTYLRYTPTREKIHLRALSTRTRQSNYVQFRNFNDI